MYSLTCRVRVMLL